MQLEELFDYKNKFMENILTNPEIVRLIDENATVETAGELVYKNVFPLEYIPTTLHDGITFVCIDVDIQSVINKTYLVPVIYIWVCSHRSRLRLPEGGVRIDKLCSEICKQINGSREFGLGELNLSWIKRFAPVTDYQGRCMMFTAKEFNRQYDPNKYTPTNRKDN